GGAGRSVMRKCSNPASRCTPGADETGLAVAVDEILASETVIKGTRPSSVPERSCSARVAAVAMKIAAQKTRLCASPANDCRSMCLPLSFRPPRDGGQEPDLYSMHWRWQVCVSAAAAPRASQSTCGEQGERERRRFRHGGNPKSTPSTPTGSPMARDRLD